MPAWIPYLPSIISALYQLTKLLIELTNGSGDDIKACGLAIEEARKLGDVSKLTALIEKMKGGQKCD